MEATNFDELLEPNHPISLPTARAKESRLEAALARTDINTLETPIETAQELIRAKIKITNAQLQQSPEDGGLIAREALLTSALNQSAGGNLELMAENLAIEAFFLGLKIDSLTGEQSATRDDDQRDRLAIQIRQLEAIATAYRRLAQRLIE